MCLHPLKWYLGVLCFVLFVVSAPATVIYEHHFNGSYFTYLNGQSPDVGSGSWVAHSGWNRGWRNDGTPYRYSSATLAFTPQPGKVYLLSARLMDVVGNNDWLALGFTAGSSTERDSNADRFIEGATAGQPWMIRRGDSATQADQAFTGPGTAGAANITTPDRSEDVDYAIRLDTRQSQWIAEWMVKPTDQPNWQIVRTHAYASPPSIGAVGLAHGNSGVDGRIGHFRLEEVDPEFYFVQGGQPVDAAVMDGASAVFEATFASLQTPSVTWYRQVNGAWVELLPAAGVMEMLVEFDADTGAYRAVLKLHEVAAEDEGFYYCAIWAGGTSIHSEPARLTLKQMVAHWTLGESGYVQGVHLDAAAGLELVSAAEPAFAAGAAGVARTAVRVGPGGVGTSEPLAAAFSDGFALSLWAQLDDTASLTVNDGERSLVGGDGVAGQWVHWAFVFDGATAVVYHDGSRQAEQPWPLSATYEMILELGHAFGQKPLSGVLEDVRLYNFTLTDDEVYELYARRTGKGGCVLDYAYWLDLSGPYGWPDCRIDLHDFAVLAHRWLALQDPSADLPTLVEFAQAWLSGGLAMND